MKVSTLSIQLLTHMGLMLRLTVPRSSGQDFTLAKSGASFPINGAIDINTIGDGFTGESVTEEGALLCHTDDPTCCTGVLNTIPNGGGRGEWYLPGETVSIPPPTDANADFYRSRGTSVLRLNRRNRDPPTTTPTGVYRCEIPTTSGTVNKHIGVYNTATVARCPNLVLTNGVVTYNSATIPGKVATHTCKSGYTLSGSVTRTCLTSPGWDGSAPTCISGTVEPTTMGPTTMGPTTMGPTTMGTTTMEPTTMGPTTMPPDTCMDLMNPQNGAIMYSGPDSPNARSVGTVATYSCSSGYTLNGAMTQTCMTGGTWSGPVPSCTAIVCSDLASLDNGMIFYSTGSLNARPVSSIATHSCTTMGYSLDGDVVRTCQNDGEWSGTTPTCQVSPVSTCSDLPPPASGMVVYSSGPPNARPVSSTVTYSCNKGYSLNGGSTRTCQNGGTWSGGEPTCDAIDCGSPPSITNGSPGSPTSTTFGGTVTYTCDSGYTLSGSAMIACLATGMWSSLPSCIAINCGPPPNIEGGSRVFTATAFQSTVTYSCNVNNHIILAGSASGTCLSSGLWSDTPTCTAPPPVYLSLFSTNYITSISEILLSSVGEGAGSYLTCRTDDTNCCREAESGVAGGIGAWHYPNGSVVQSSSDGGDLYISRDGPMVVNLNRRNDVMGPTGLYCCVVPTSTGNQAFCATLVSMLTQPGALPGSGRPGLGPPSSQPDNTGAIVGGVVAFLLGLVLILAVTAVIIAYLVLKQRRTGGVNLKRDPPDIPLSDKVQSAPAQTYETVDATYEEIGGTRPLKVNCDYTQNQAYVVTTAPLRGEGVVNTGGSGNPTEVSLVGGVESMIYEN